jgi:3-oxoacyl-[acyl-carrier-protein] synthase-1
VAPLYLTAFTVSSCLGAGIEATKRALIERRPGLAPCRFETVALDTCVGQVPDASLEPLTGELAQFDCRNHRLARLALRGDGFEEAVGRAAARYGAQRIGVFLGTSTSGILQTELAYRRRDPKDGSLPADFHYTHTHNNFSLARFVSRCLGLEGPGAVISTACSSSAKVFGNAARMIAAGWCDAAVVGGADSLCLTTLYGFNSLELVSKRPCRPFDLDRDGISIGEGAGFALLEPERGPRRAGEVALLGVGESSDAYHMSSPHPEGAGAREAMQNALQQAHLEASAIGYINLHGTATRANDAAESRAVLEVFAQTPCSSTKGWTGHTLGACGIIEAVICALALQHAFLPGSLNTEKLDPDLGVNYLLQGEQRSVRYAVSNAFGFGGTNCSLVFGRAA